MTMIIRAQFLLLATLCLVSFGASAQKITALPALGTAPASTDIMPMVDLGTTTTKKMTVANLFTGPTVLGQTNNASATFGRGTQALTGTVATNGSTTITGTSTKFLTELNVGDTVTITGETSRVISTIASDLSAVLTVAASTTASGLAISSTALTGTSAATVGANGRILFPEGTLLKPSIAFGLIDDGTGMGFYERATNTISVSANGTQGAEFGVSGLDGGGTLLNGFRQQTAARTGSATEGGNQLGGQIGFLTTNTGTASLVVRTWPTISAGQWFDDECNDTDGIKIVAPASVTIGVGNYATAAAGYIQSTVIGSTVHMVALDTTHIIVYPMTGTWTDGTETWVDGIPANTSKSTANTTNLTVTPTAVTGLSKYVYAGLGYEFTTVLFVNDSIAADGARVDFDGGTATMTDVRIHCTLFDTALLASTQTTAIATDFTAATVTGDAMMECHGGFTVNAAGTFVPRVAKNTNTTGTITTYKNSTLVVHSSQN